MKTKAIPQAMKKAPNGSGFTEDTIRRVIELETRRPTAKRYELAEALSLHPMSISNVRATPLYKRVKADLELAASKLLASRMASIQEARMVNAEAAMTFQAEALEQAKPELKAKRPRAAVLRAGVDMAMIPLREVYKTPVQVQVTHADATSFNDLDAVEAALEAEGIIIRGEGEDPTTG